MASKTTTKTKVDQAVINDIADAAEEQVAREVAVPKKAMVAKKIDPNQIVTVRNGFQGVLVYKSKRTGEVWRWESFGDEQDIELSELKNAKNSNKKFFERNWFMFEEDWVVDYLGVKQYYKHALAIDEFDSLFTKPADEVQEIIRKMSAGQKQSVAYRARQLVADREIDSIKVIDVLEKTLGVELIER